MPARHPLPDPPVQTVTLHATGGSFALTYSGQTTSPLAFDLSAADLLDALEHLGRIGAGNVVVTGDDGGPFELRFGGELTGRDIAVVEAEPDGLEGTVVVTIDLP